MGIFDRLNLGENRARIDFPLDVEDTGDEETQGRHRGDTVRCLALNCL